MYANLQGANFKDTHLHGTNFGSANLNEANLQGTDLRYAILNDAQLRGANLENALVSVSQSQADALINDNDLENGIEIKDTIVEKNKELQTEKIKKATNKYKRHAIGGLVHNQNEDAVFNCLRNFFNQSRVKRIPAEKIEDSIDILRRMGIDPKQLIKNGEAEKFFAGEKTEMLYDVRTAKNGKVYHNKAKLQMTYDKDKNKVFINQFFKYPKINFDATEKIYGLKLNDEEKKQLLSTNGLGEPRDINFNGKKVSCLVSHDTELNSLAFYPVSRVQKMLEKQETFCGHKFTDDDKKRLALGERLYIKDFKTDTGKKISAYLHFNAAKQGLEMQRSDRLAKSLYAELSKNKELQEQYNKGEAVKLEFQGSDNLKHTAIIQLNKETQKMIVSYPAEYNNINNLLMRPEEEQIKIARQTTNPKVLDTLAKSGNEKVLLEVVRNEHTSEENLHNIAKTCDNSKVKEVICYHPKVAQATLTELMDDPNELVRSGVAKNNKTRYDDLKILSKDGDKDVKRFANNSIEKMGKSLETARENIDKGIYNKETVFAIEHHGYDEEKADIKAYLKNIKKEDKVQELQEKVQGIKPKIIKDKEVEVELPKKRYGIKR